MLSYHRQTFELLGREPLVSQDAVAQLDLVQQRLGFPLPAALREWYSLEGAVQILKKYSNDDPPVPINELGSPLSHFPGEPVDLTRRGLLPIRFENQGVCVWAARLDAGDDPEVVVDYDSGLREWLWCASSFSNHVHCWVWDYSFFFPGGGILTANVDDANEEALVRFLRSEFREGPPSGGWPATRQYRFERDDQRILVWGGDRADCTLVAPTTKMCAEVARSIHRAVPSTAPFLVHWPELTELLSDLVWRQPRSADPKNS